jgi:predicted RNase H-like nuclease (RuvC/YqgF family)
MASLADLKSALESKSSELDRAISKLESAQKDLSWKKILSQYDCVDVANAEDKVSELRNKIIELHSDCACLERRIAKFN